jgi:hypothetical protein
MVWNEILNPNPDYAKTKSKLFAAFPREHRHSRECMAEPPRNRLTDLEYSGVETFHISAVGRYDDTLEKKDGKWFISKRVRTE